MNPCSRAPGAGRHRAGACGRLVAGQRRAGECLDERGRGCGAGEEGSLAVGPGPPVVEPVQQPGDDLGIAVVAERGADMIEEAGAERRRIDGLPGDIGGGSKADSLARHLEVQQLDPADVVLIGDVVDDADAARAAGTQCVLVSTGAMTRESLEATGAPVTASIAEALRQVG